MAGSKPAGKLHGAVLSWSVSGRSWNARAVQAADYGDGYVHRRVPREKMKLVTPTAGISMGFGRDRVESAGSDQLKNEGKG